MKAIFLTFLFTSLAFHCFASFSIHHPKSVDELREISPPITTGLENYKNFWRRFLEENNILNHPLGEKTRDDEFWRMYSEQNKDDRLVKKFLYKELEGTERFGLRTFIVYGWIDGKGVFQIANNFKWAFLIDQRSK